MLKTRQTSAKGKQAASSDLLRDLAVASLLVRDSERAKLAQDDLLVQVRKIGRVLLSQGRWHCLLPRSWRMRLLRRSLLKSGAFDSETYLLLNQDVAAARAEPVLHFLDRGIEEGRRDRADDTAVSGHPPRDEADGGAGTHIAFDADYYARRYPDVRQSGLVPRTHFDLLGRKLGRRGDDRSAGNAANVQPLDVLFVDGTLGSPSTPYRVDRVAEGLRRQGLRVRSVSGSEVTAVAREGVAARAVIFFRTPLEGDYGPLARQMRSAGSLIGFDIDDLVFDEQLVPHISGYSQLSESDRRQYLRGVRGYRDFVAFADFCTAPTSFLVERLKALGKEKVFRVRNSFDEAQATALAELSAAADDDGRFVVGYYSGTLTHQADLRQAGEALARLMEENESVAFRLVGEFNLADYPQLQKFSDGSRGQSRIERVKLMPHSEMLRDQLLCDVIIAPLEVGNPFCEAKSELKFFEASLARIPVIASPTATYRHATRDGQFAQLADSPDEWLAALKRIVVQPEKHAAIAQVAREYVIGEFASAAAGLDAARALRAVEAISGESAV